MLSSELVKSNEKCLISQSTANEVALGPVPWWTRFNGQTEFG